MLRSFTALIITLWPLKYSFHISLMIFAIVLADRIKMSICAGAPDNMVPFDRAASPWGSQMSYQGLYQVPKRRSRSLLWEEDDGGLDNETSTDFPDFDTLLEALDDEQDNGHNYADVLDDKDDLHLHVGSNVAAAEEDCPNKYGGDNATMGTWSRRMLGRVRTRGGAFGAGTEEKRTVRANPRLSLQ